MPLILGNVTFGSGITVTGPPALTFTTPASAGAVGTLYSVAVNSAGLAVAVGISSTNTPQFTTSSNGTTWTTPATMNGSAVPSIQRWVTVNPGTGLFVSVGQIGTSSTGPTFATSTNGPTWTTPATMNGSTAAISMYGVAYSPTLNLFVAVGYDSANPYYATSTNGSTWTTPATIGSSASALMKAVVWNSALGLFVAFGSFGNVAYYSTSADGSTWIQPVSISGASNINATALAVSDSGRMVGIGYTGLGSSVYTTSTDGTTWSAVASIGTGAMFGITWANNLWVTIGYANSSQGPLFSTSVDGTTWTTPAAMNGSTTRANMNAVVGYRAQFIGVGQLVGSTSGVTLGT